VLITVEGLSSDCSIELRRSPGKKMSRLITIAQQAQFKVTPLV